MKRGLCLLLALVLIFSLSITAYASTEEIIDPTEIPATEENSEPLETTESEEGTEPEETTEPVESTEPEETAEPEETDAVGECTCGTEEADIHATSCPLYVAPDAPVCTCAEKCGDEANDWCDVCGVYGASECQGKEEAEMYEATGAYEVKIPANISVDPEHLTACYTVASEGFDLPEGGYVTVTATTSGQLRSETDSVSFTNTLSGNYLYATGETLSGTIRVEEPERSGIYTGTITFLIRYYSGI